MENKRYTTDLTDEQRALIRDLIPPEKPGGRPRIICMRAVVNGLLYLSRTGSEWRLLPKDYPHYSTLYGYFRDWRIDGTWDTIHDKLREQVRVKAGRVEQPTAAIIDSQTVKTTEQRGLRGYDGHKKIKGRKCHIAVDVLGLLLSVVVHSAGICDRAGAKLLLPLLAPVCTGLKVIWADGGYTGKLVDWVWSSLGVVLDIIKRPTKAFKIEQWRWIVERTFGWLNRYRRLSKDYEELTVNSETWIKIAMINIMVHKLKPG